MKLSKLLADLIIDFVGARSTGWDSEAIRLTLFVIAMIVIWAAAIREPNRHTKTILAMLNNESERSREGRSKSIP